MHTLTYFTALLYLLSTSLRNGALCATLDQWRERSIYQVLTDRFALTDGSNGSCDTVDGMYCGGSWQGIKNNLGYIQGMNFDAIWISPVVGQLPQRTGDGESYTSYWQQNLYALNSRFGTPQDLQDLISAVHDRGMYLMLDVVVNHMGYSGAPQSVDYSIFNPFDDEKYYHDYCAISDDANSTNREQCWLGDQTVPLVDLRTENQEVRDLFGEWIAGMVRNYSIDGLRIDTALNVEPSFFEKFVKSAGVFATGEAMSGDNTLACPYADTIGSILNYPIYYPLTRAFTRPAGSINDLVDTIVTTQANCRDPTAFGSFSENHDVARFAQMTSDLSQAKNILTYTLLADGIPIVYQGQEQHMKGGIAPYINRAPLWQAGFDTSALLYTHIAALLAARQTFIKQSANYTTSLTEVVYQDYHSLALRKGANGSQVLTILNNNGADCEAFTLPVAGHGFAPGTLLTEVLSCTNSSVNGTGWVDVAMGQGLPKVFYPASLLADCRMASTSPTSTTTTAAGPTASAATGTASGPRASQSKLALGGAAGGKRVDWGLSVMSGIVVLAALGVGMMSGV